MASPTNFTGAVDGDPANTNNWSNDLPVNGGVAIVPASTGVKIGGGNLSAIDLDLWIVEPGYKFEVGASGSRLRIAAAKMIHAGDAKGWYNAEHATADIDQFICRSPAGVDLDDNGTAKIIKILVELGRCDYNCGGGSDLVEVVGDQARFEAIDGAGTIAAYAQNAGVANIDAITITAAQIVGSALCTMLATNNGTFTDLFVAGAARVFYNSTTTLALARVYGGLLSFARDARAKTVTELRSRRPGLIDKGFAQVTFGTASSFQDGTVIAGAADV